MQNIGASNADDAFYRYKMPKLVAKIEGRGNGIKTNIVNNVDIAKALERNPEYVLKYFGCELGAQTNFDAKTGTSIVNGAHDTKKLCELLEGFIKKYVQCYSCGNPETQVKIKKDFIHLKCKACGYVSDVDMRHKLNTFILKNPPASTLKKEEIKIKKAEEERVKDAEALGKKEKKEKKEKKDKKKKKKKEGDGEGSPREGEEDDDEDEDEAADDDVVWMTDTSAEAVKRRAEEQLSAATAAMVTQGNIEAEEEAARKRAEKEKEDAARKEAEEEAARLAAEEAQAAEAARLAEEAKAKLAVDEADPVVKLRSLIAEQDPSAVIAQLKAMSVEGGMAGKMCLLYKAVYGSTDEKLAAILKAQQPIFAAFAQDASSQLAQLIALEHFLAVVAPERIKETPLVLKALYDCDLAEDDVIVAWAGKMDAAKIVGVPAEAAKAVRKAAAPVVDWLQEEDDDEDDE